MKMMNLLSMLFRKFQTENNLTRFSLKVVFISRIILSPLISGFSLYINQQFSSSIHPSTTTINPEPPFPIAIIFGAGVWRNQTPSPVLYDRVKTGVDLYKAGHVKKLLLTGDNRFKDYNEPEVMHDLAIRLGVPEEDLILDYAGRRTYDSCYRARYIFDVKRAILVTQNFHLNRALYLCKSFGIDAIGIMADQQIYPKSSKMMWIMREVLATAMAWFNVNVKSPVVVLGDKQPILM